MKEGYVFFHDEAPGKLAAIQAKKENYASHGLVNYDDFCPSEQKEATPTTRREDESVSAATHQCSTCRWQPKMSYYCLDLYRLITRTPPFFPPILSPSIDFYYYYFFVHLHPPLPASSFLGQGAEWLV